MMCGELHVRDSVGQITPPTGGIATVSPFGFISNQCSWVSVGQRIDNDHFVQVFL
jgi:hypothetical protein